MKSQQEIDLDNLNVNDFIYKYYSKPDLSGWEFWMDGTIRNVFDEEKRHLFLDSMKYRNKEFNFQKLEDFYSKISDLNIDDDIKKYFAYMHFEGFFEYYGISFLDWLTIKNFTNPVEEFELPLSIYEAMKVNSGLNYIKRQLMNLKYWRIVY